MQQLHKQPSPARPTNQRTCQPMNQLTNKQTNLTVSHASKPLTLLLSIFRWSFQDRSRKAPLEIAWYPFLKRCTGTCENPLSNKFSRRHCTLRRIPPGTSEWNWAKWRENTQKESHGWDLSCQATDGQPRGRQLSSHNRLWMYVCGTGRSSHQGRRQDGNSFLASLQQEQQNRPQRSGWFLQGCSRTSCSSGQCWNRSPLKPVSMQDLLPQKIPWQHQESSDALRIGDASRSYKW